jgi:DNA polymerase
MSGSTLTSAAEFVPDSRSLRALREAAADCRGCSLWRDATQTVFGEGPRKAKLMLVGEQPGDREDVEGEPFVGPAGRVLDEALLAAGIARGDVYLTNAVKHFKWRPRGKRRLHQTPRAGEINACRPWLEAELEAVRPVGVLALGAVAGRSLFGPKVRVGKDHGRLLDSELAPLAALTLHPSAILRLRDHDEREEAQAALVEDLQMVAAAVAERDSTA